MTIKVTVKNEDSRENAIIAVETQTDKGVAEGTPKQLKGGESTEVNIHSTKQFVVKEVRNG